MTGPREMPQAPLDEPFDPYDDSGLSYDEKFQRDYPRPALDELCMVVEREWAGERDATDEQICAEAERRLSEEPANDLAEHHDYADGDPADEPCPF